MDSWYDHRQHSWLDGTRRRRRYISGEWPDDFLDSVIIPVEKKQRGAQECVDFRTISLVSHASKIMLKILTHRLESTAESNLGRISLVLEKVVAQRDAIAALRVLYEGNLEYNNYLPHNSSTLR